MQYFLVDKLSTLTQRWKLCQVAVDPTHGYLYYSAPLKRSDVQNARGVLDDTVHSSCKQKCSTSSASRNGDSSTAEQHSTSHALSHNRNGVSSVLTHDAQPHETHRRQQESTTCTNTKTADLSSAPGSACRSICSVHCRPAVAVVTECFDRKPVRVRWRRKLALSKVSLGADEYIVPIGSSVLEETLLLTLTVYGEECALVHPRHHKNVRVSGNSNTNDDTIDRIMATSTRSYPTEPLIAHASQQIEGNTAVHGGHMCTRSAPLPKKKQHRARDGHRSASPLVTSRLLGSPNDSEESPYDTQVMCSDCDHCVVSAEQTQQQKHASPKRSLTGKRDTQRSCAAMLAQPTQKTTTTQSRVGWGIAHTSHSSISLYDRRERDRQQSYAKQGDCCGGGDREYNSKNHGRARSYSAQVKSEKTDDGGHPRNRTRAIRSHELGGLFPAGLTESPGAGPETPKSQSTTNDLAHIYNSSVNYRECTNVCRQPDGSMTLVHRRVARKAHPRVSLSLSPRRSHVTHTRRTTGCHSREHFSSSRTPRRQNNDTNDSPDDDGGSPRFPVTHPEFPSTQLRVSYLAHRTEPLASSAHRSTSAHPSNNNSCANECEEEACCICCSCSCCGPITQTAEAQWAEDALDHDDCASLPRLTAALPHHAVEHSPQSSRATASNAEEQTIRAACDVPARNRRAITPPSFLASHTAPSALEGSTVCVSEKKRSSVLFTFALLRRHRWRLWRSKSKSKAIGHATVNIVNNHYTNANHYKGYISSPSSPLLGYVGRFTSTRHAATAAAAAATSPSRAARLLLPSHKQIDSGKTRFSPSRAQSSAKTVTRSKPHVHRSVILRANNVTVFRALARVLHYSLVTHTRTNAAMTPLHAGLPLACDPRNGLPLASIPLHMRALLPGWNRFVFYTMLYGHTVYVRGQREVRAQPSYLCVTAEGVLVLSSIPHGGRSVRAEDVLRVDHVRRGAKSFVALQVCSEETTTAHSHAHNDNVPGETSICDSNTIHVHTKDTSDDSDRHVRSRYTNQHPCCHMNLNAARSENTRTLCYLLFVPVKPLYPLQTGFDAAAAVERVVSVLRRAWQYTHVNGKSPSSSLACNCSLSTSSLPSLCRSFADCTHECGSVFAYIMQRGVSSFMTTGRETSLRRPVEMMYKSDLAQATGYTVVRGNAKTREKQSTGRLLSCQDE